MACTFSMLLHGSGRSSEYCSICEIWLLQSYARKAFHSGSPASMNSIMVIMTRRLFVSHGSNLFPPDLPPWSSKLVTDTPLSAVSRIRHPGASHQDAARAQHILHQSKVVPLDLAARHMPGHSPLTFMPISISTSPAGLASFFSKPLACGSLLPMSVSTSWLPRL